LLVVQLKDISLDSNFFHIVIAVQVPLFPLPLWSYQVVQLLVQSICNTNHSLRLGGSSFLKGVGYFILESPYKYFTSSAERAFLKV
jgi:hypothetical protein